MIIDGAGCPPNDDVVIAVWTEGTEKFACIATYSPETREWMALNSDIEGDMMNEPDYWIEYPDTHVRQLKEEVNDNGD